MKRNRDNYIYSPSDLIVFMESRFDSWMDRSYCDYPDEMRPDAADEAALILQKHGAAHESAVLRHLKELRKEVIEVPESIDAEGVTLESIRAGREVIFQGVISAGQFAGKTDFLVKVEEPSLLGSWSYEIWDTKLARKPKPYFIIQLCCYAEMLEKIQGVRPQHLTVVLGDGSQKSFRTEDYFYFYEALKNQFLTFQGNFDKNTPPDPSDVGPFSRWKTEAERRMEESDHLSRVAGIRKVQIRKLRAAGIPTLKALATSEVTNVPKMEASTFNTLQEQAKLQVQTHADGTTAYKLVPPNPKDPNRGLVLLPPHSDLDVFFDMEGYPLLEGGLEYLFGAVHVDGGAPEFKDWWAHNREEERVAFEQFVDWIYARWQKDNNMHVYHYAAYEVSALRRLMGRYGTREKEVDELLTNEVFVDLYQIVRQALRVGEPSYSIKYIEHLYRGKREGGVATATESVVSYERWLEQQDGSSWNDSEILKAIRDYNRDDCMSTQQLTVWLRDLQQHNGIRYTPKRKGPREETEKFKDRKAREAFAEKLLAEIPSDRSGAPEKWRIQELLAWLLGFHVREAKPSHWRKFDRHAMTEQELIEDLDCLGGLTKTSHPTFPIKNSFGYEYSFDPNQDTKLQVGDDCFYAHELSKTTKIASLDRKRGRVVIQLGKKREVPPNRLSLIPIELVDASVIADAIFEIAKRWHETKNLPPAINAFLRRSEPRVKGTAIGDAIIPPNSSDLVAATIGAIVNLDHSTLCIQGPPGTGKTSLAAKAITELVRRGKRVGVTSNSHKAIENLMRRVVEEAGNQRVGMRVFKIGKDDAHGQDQEVIAGVEYSVSAKEFFNSGAPFDLVGGTAWAFSNPDAAGTIDYLFVDEAGQVSVANLVGMSASTKNIVLLGDQMQLEQPIQGSHPGESGMSTLDYLLQEHATIPNHLGVFLDTTRRMHPGLCAVVSAAVYENRLHAEPGNERQVLIPPANLSDSFERTSGVVFVPVEHEGNTQGSEEEVEVIADLVEKLLKCEVFDKRKGAATQVSLRDILIVAPYNMQVRMLSARLPGAQVASVDKFQGQEAAIVILSMCASEGNSSPRGIEFLFSKNRLNVAISRAKSIAFVVGCSNLVNTSCSTIDQMSLLNFFCRINRQNI